MKISISGFREDRAARMKRSLQERKSRKSKVELTQQATTALKISEADVEVLRNWTQLHKGRKASDSSSTAIIRVGRKISKIYPPKPPKVLYRGLSLTMPMLLKLLNTGELPTKGKANSWTSDKRAALNYANSEVGLLLKRNSADLDVVVHFSTQVQHLYSNKNQALDQKEYLCAADKITLSDVAYFLLKPPAADKLYSEGFLERKPATKTRSILALTKSGLLKPSAIALPG